MAEQSQTSLDHKSKQNIENVGKVVAATASDIKKFESGDASEITSGALDIISSVAEYAGKMMKKTESDSDDDISSSFDTTEDSVASLRLGLSKFSDSHDSSLSKSDFEKKIDEISEWVEKQKNSPKESKFKKQNVENVGKVATATINGINKFASGDASDITSGTLDIISSVAVCAGGMVGGPVGEAVGAVIATFCSIIGALFTANKSKEPSVVEQLAKVVHKELVDFNKKLQDEKYNGLIKRVSDQKAQLRKMERGEELDDPNLWTDYVQFMGEVSNRFESPLPFKYEDNLSKDPDVADFVTALATYCQAYSCFIALLLSAKGTFADLEAGRRHYPWHKYKDLEYLKMVDRKISGQRQDVKQKLAFLSDEKYLTFLGRLPSEGGKLTKIVILSRSAEQKDLVEKVRLGCGLPRMPALKTVESKAKIVSRQSVILKVDRAPDPLHNLSYLQGVQLINETKFPMKIVCGTVGEHISNLKFVEVVQPRSYYDRPANGTISTGGYILLYLDGKVRSDDEPHGADVTHILEFALSDPDWGSRKVSIQDKTDSEFTKGKVTYDKMEDGETKTTYWMTNGTHYMASGELFNESEVIPVPPGPHGRGGTTGNASNFWRFVIEDFDPIHDVETRDKNE